MFSHVSVIWASLVAQMVKSQPAMREPWAQSLSWENPPEKGMASQLQHSCLESPQGQRSLVGHGESDAAD